LFIIFRLIFGIIGIIVNLFACQTSATQRRWLRCFYPFDISTRFWFRINDDEFDTNKHKSMRQQALKSRIIRQWIPTELQFNFSKPKWTAL
jgi:hypothetical protein